MFPAASLLTLLLTLSITGPPFEVRNSPTTLPITRRDSSARGHAGSTPVTNNDSNYISAVRVGNSPQPVNNLIVDTGSSNTWVGASTKYVVTSTSINTSQPVASGYGGSAFFFVSIRTEYLDTVTLGSGLTITNQSIGVASNSSGFTGVDGILGIGPVDLTECILTDLPTTTIPTVTDNLYSQGTIPQDVVSVFFEPSSSQAKTKGELTFGGTDAAKYTGDIAYTPMATDNLASTYWSIDKSITYGSTTTLSYTAGIVDTGTIFILIATGHSIYAFIKYQSATGATLDTATDYLMASFANYAALKKLDFHIGTPLFSDVIYLVVNDLGRPSDSGLDYAFLQRFYSVFDTTYSRVGFTRTLFTNATTN
ncbi:aspartic proteinase [Suillus spraguei]|nr:aspartic proteinase [Suillus spraguei]